MKNEVTCFCEKLYSYASENCGCEFQISASFGDSFECDILSGEINKYNVNDFINVSFKVKYNGKIGSASTTALDVDSIPGLISSAKKNAELIESTDEQFIFAGSPEYKHPAVYSDKLNSLSAKDKINFAKELERRTLKADERIIRVHSCTVAASENTYIIRNSHGLNLSETSGSFILYVIPIAKIGEDMNNSVSFYAGFDADGLDIDKIVRQGVTEALDFCGSKPVKSGSYRVILRNSAFSDLVETFSAVFFGEYAQRGLSMLAGKEGQKIAAGCVTVYDDATIDCGFGSRGFDSEGVAGQKTAVIENGTLKTLLYNLKTAKKAGVKSTANTSGLSNFIFMPGSYSLEQLAEKAENGLIITELNGLHAGANATTGDFSLLAKGYLIENGVKTRPVSGITVSGNFYDLLKNIGEMGNDVYSNPFGEAIVTPSVLLNKPMSVAGE